VIIRLVTCFTHWGGIIKSVWKIAIGRSTAIGLKCTTNRLVVGLSLDPEGNGGGGEDTK